MGALRRPVSYSTPVYPKTWDELEAIGHGIAGTPATVRDYVGRLQAESGVNYVLAQMMFGDLVLRAGVDVDAAVRAGGDAGLHGARGGGMR